MTQHSFPATRYQGSKYKLTSWLKEQLEGLDFDIATDAFGGTAAVSYLFKTMGKTVIYNDLLQFNKMIGKALIENDQTQLSEEDIESILHPVTNRTYNDLIARHFSGIYYTDEENQWLDIVIQNILKMPHPIKQAMAFWALSQAAMSKRPYNLFHRKNLNVRTSNVTRTFGNKKTWDRPFQQHFLKFSGQINQAIFDNGNRHQVHCVDANALSTETDLVYIDPPYIPQKGSLTRYRDYYHFLEGALLYPQWEESIDFSSKHRKLKSVPSPWENRGLITDAFRQLFATFKDAIIVVSYRKDGIPSIETLRQLLLEVKPYVHTRELDYQYALSKRKSKEVLLIGCSTAHIG